MRQHAPLARRAIVTSRSRLVRSAVRPPQIQPAPPAAIVPKEISETTAVLSAPGLERAALAARNAGIHVQKAYSSNMWPRYPLVARRHSRTRATAATRPHENGRGAKG